MLLGCVCVCVSESERETDQLTCGWWTAILTYPPNVQKVRDHSDLTLFLFYKIKIIFEGWLLKRGEKERLKVEVDFIITTLLVRKLRLAIVFTFLNLLG